MRCRNQLSTSKHLRVKYTTYMYIIIRLKESNLVSWIFQRDLLIRVNITTNRQKYLFYKFALVASND
jgi:hypothetical protein